MAAVKLLVNTVLGQLVCTLYSWKIYWEHQNYYLLHPSMKSALRILALLVFWVGGGVGVENVYPDGLQFFPHVQMGNFLSSGRVKSCLGNAQID